MTDTAPATIRPKVRDSILQSLRAGVVPKVGQQFIQVGRAKELEALLGDVDRISDGGSSFRLVIGDYGAGKTFFLMLVRAVALERRLVTLHADLNPDRRLQGSGGHARSLYTELLRNASTRATPDGGAIPSIVEKFVSSAVTEAESSGSSAGAVISKRLEVLSELVGGFDFASVIRRYWEGYDQGNDQLTSDAIRWIRGEFSTKTDAKAALGVRTIIDDTNWYDYLKLLALFVRMAGYGGIMVCLDELVNLYKLNHTTSRAANYEQLLAILNDSLQGTAKGLGWVLGGTPEFLLDTRRGLYSYRALQSRLAENQFVTDGLVDFTGPVLRLASLSPEDFYILLMKIRNVYAGGDESKNLLSDAALQAFMQHCESRIGSAYFRTPRETIMPFVDLLAVLEQNPEANWRDLIGHIEITPEENPDLAPLSEDIPGDEEPPSSDSLGAPETAGPSLPVSTPAGPTNDDLTQFRL